MGSTSEHGAQATERRPRLGMDGAEAALEVREMRLEEVDLIIDYFHGSTVEHLEQLGVDPTRLPDPPRWRQRYEEEYDKPIEQRASLQVLWQLDGVAVGFSTCSKIVYGEHAHMHLHVTDAAQRGSGIGSACVPRSADIYFDRLRLTRLFCEPNAFNVAPNRTLQRSGFTYVKTHMTVPGRLNTHQAVTRWVLER